MKIRKKTKQMLLKELKDLFREISEAERAEAENEKGGEDVKKSSEEKSGTYIIPGTEYWVIPGGNFVFKKEKKSGK